MSDNHRVYRTITRASMQLYPGEPKGNTARMLTISRNTFTCNSSVNCTIFCRPAHELSSWVMESLMASPSLLHLTGDEKRLVIIKKLVITR
jgi:hypothetical protein